MTDNTPVEDGHNNATEEAKLAGIVEQTRGDIAQGNVADKREALVQRLEDARLEVGDAEFERLIALLD